MAKKAYVGVNGISKNVKNIYVGVNGVPKKVVKGYVGVNGVPKLFWDGGTTPISASWDYWTSINGLLFQTEVGNVVKQNPLIAYYASVWLYDQNTDDTYLTAILLSPDRQAVTYTWGGDEYRYKNSIVDVNNITWYFSGGDKVFYNTPSPNCIINTPETAFSGYNRLVLAAQALLDKIYAVPFHENYQPSETYTLNTGDIEKTVRKLCGIYLFRNVGRYTGTDRYIAESDNIDAIISTLVGRVPANNNLVYMTVFHDSSYAYDSITLSSGNPTLTSQEVDFRHTFRGYDYCEMVSSWTYNFRTTCTINANGISYSDNYAQRSYMGIIGMDIQDNGTSSTELEYKATNAGIDL